MTTRDDIRAKVFASKDLGSKVLDFFGTQIELRQPKLRDIMEIQQAAANTADGEVPQSVVVSMLLQYAYVPGSNEKIFEEGDSESLLNLPFGEDLIAVTNGLQELTKVNFPKSGAFSTEDQTSTS